MPGVYLAFYLFMLIKHDPDNISLKYLLQYFFENGVLLKNILAAFNKNETSVAPSQLGDNLSVMESDMTVRTVPSSVKVPYASDNVDYEQFLTHPVQILSETWSSATVGGQVTANLWADYLSIISALPIGNKLKNFLFADTTLVIKVVVQGAPYAYGQLVYAFDPSPSRVYEETAAATFAAPQKVRSKLIPHLAIDPSKDGTYEIRLPAPTINGLFSMKVPDYGSYTFNRIVFNPIKSGNASVPSVRIVTWMTLENPHFTGLTLTSSSLVAEKKHEGVLSGPLRTLNTVAKRFRSVPVIGEYATLFSDVAGPAASFLSWFGYAKPNITDVVLPVLNRTVTNYSSVDSRTSSVMLSSATNNSISLSDSFYGIGSFDDMDIQKLCAKPGLVKQFNWSTATSPDTYLFTLPVNPTYQFDLDFPALTHGYELTPLGICAHPCTYWTGDIDVTVEIVASIYHRATLLIAFDPAQPNFSTTPSTTVYQVLKSQIVTISGNTSVTFTCPWKQQQPFKLVDQVHSDAYPSSQQLITSNGKLGFYCINPVTTNGSTDPIEINVYYSSKNIKFAIPATRHIANDRIILTSSEMVPAPMDNEPDDTQSVFLRFFGEDVVTTVKKICTKLSLSLITAEVVESYANNRIVTAVYPVGNIPAQNGGVYIGNGVSFLDYFANAFVGLRGSVSYAFIPTLYAGNLTTGSVVSFCSLISGIQADSSANHLIFTSTNNPIVTQQTAYSYGFQKVHPNVEFTVPHYYPGYFRPTLPAVNPGTYYAEAFALQAQVNQTTAMDNGQLLNALGDDGAFCFFRGIPSSIYLAPV